MSQGLKPSSTGSLIDMNGNVLLKAAVKVLFEDIDDSSLHTQKRKRPEAKLRAVGEAAYRAGALCG